MNQTVKPELKSPEMKAMIARFMELKGASKVGGWRFLCKDGYWRLPDAMLYDSSWDWLMPVIEKIGDTRFKSGFGFKVEIVNGYTKIDGTGERLFYNSCIEGSMLNATYKAVVEFIVRWNGIEAGYMKLREGGESNGN